MAKIRWTQRVLGREPGDIENVEIDTEFMVALLAQGRYELVDDKAEAKEAAETKDAILIAAGEKKAPRRTKFVDAKFETEVEAAVAGSDMIAEGSPEA